MSNYLWTTGKWDRLSPLSIIPTVLHAHSLINLFCTINWKKYSPLWDHHIPHMHAHIHIHTYIGVRFITPSLHSMKKREERMKEEGREVDRCLYIPAFPRLFWSQELFNLVHIYGTHMFCGPSFIIWKSVERDLLATKWKVLIKIIIWAVSSTMMKYAKFRFNKKKSIIFWFPNFYTEHLFTSHGTPLFCRTYFGKCWYIQRCSCA